MSDKYVVLDSFITEAVADSEQCRWTYDIYAACEEMNRLAQQLAEANAEIERLKQAISDMSSDYHRAFNENQAYLEFVAAYDARKAFQKKHQFVFIPDYHGKEIELYEAEYDARQALDKYFQRAS